MIEQQLRIVPVFTADDQAWLRRSAVEIPRFWHGHAVAPALGDVLRVGGRQFTVHARVWEHDDSGPLLRLFLGNDSSRTRTSRGIVVKTSCIHAGNAQGRAQNADEPHDKALPEFPALA